MYLFTNHNFKEHSLRIRCACCLCVTTDTRKAIGCSAV